MTIRFDLTLGAELGRGGEGVVHDLPRHPGFAAKVYLSRPDETKRQHLLHLISHASPRLTAISAWPQALAVTPDGEEALVLPKVENAVQIHDFYGAASRLAHFPQATWADCVRVAQRVAAIVEEVHKAGFILADLNEQNFLIDQSTQPVLIDCDSVMSTHDGRETFAGPYRDEWLPPELIGEDLHLIERTRNHDNFALALMLFRLLMLGRHPFVGVPVSGPMPADAEAVKGHHFVYAGMSLTMRPPDSAPDFRLLPHTLQKLFVTALGPEGRIKRPTAAEWRRALARLSRALTACPNHPAEHVYSIHVAQCPWCALAPTFDAFPAHSEVGTAPAEYPSAAPMVLPVARDRSRPRWRWSWRSRLQALCVAVTMMLASWLASLLAT